MIYEAMGFPVEVFPVLFAIGRTPGWIAQWQEMLLDSEQKIARPRQLYVGAGERDYVPIEHRREGARQPAPPAIVREVCSASSQDALDLLQAFHDVIRGRDRLVETVSLPIQPNGSHTDSLRPRDVNARAVPDEDRLGRRDPKGLT